MNQLLSEREAAEHLRCGKSTLRQWRYRNTGPKFVKINGLIRYRIEDLEAFIVSNTHTPKEEPHVRED